MLFFEPSGKHLMFVGHGVRVGRSIHAVCLGWLGILQESFVMCLLDSLHDEGVHGEELPLDMRRDDALPLLSFHAHRTSSVAA